MLKFLLKLNKKTLFLGSFLALTMLFVFPGISYGDQAEIDRLNAEIDTKLDKIQEIDREIARQRAALNDASGRANNLENTVDQLEATKNKLENDIILTENQIDKAELTIQKLNLEIGQKEQLIDRNSEALADSIRKTNQLENITWIERFLGYKTMSDFWRNFELTQKVQKQLQTEVSELVRLQQELEDKENAKTAERNELAKQKTILAGETEVVKSTAEEKVTLLQRTKQEEAEYQKLLNQKLAERKAFEEELLEIESKLNFLIDTDSYPAPRRGILSWPLDNIIVTQQFGGTQFAKQNPGIYGRPYHPGTDFGAPIGTQIKSVYGGVVRGFDNTDNYPGCNAWGGWVLVDHDNGLSSLYAHLSNILVKPGQRVERGEVIALSGNTGISTGPHLHLTIYATQGVRIGPYGSYGSSGGGCSATNATGPFADLDAYLDPMTYLPELY
jgi:murein DD-endopeptidase MepM/ murein hydrolase activator NlpD